MGSGGIGEWGSEAGSTCPAHLVPRSLNQSIVGGLRLHAQALLSVKARESAVEIRAQMFVQAEELRDGLAEHADPEYRDLATDPRIVQEIMTLAWFGCRKNWRNVRSWERGGCCWQGPKAQ